MQVRRWLHLDPPSTHRQRYREHPDHYKAHVAVKRALERGTLTKPSRCASCRRRRPLEGHHASYAREDWLRVEWLCRSCHARLHRQVEVAQSA